MTPNNNYQANDYPAAAMLATPRNVAAQKLAMSELPQEALPILASLPEIFAQPRSQIIQLSGAASEMTTAPKKEAAAVIDMATRTKSNAPSRKPGGLTPS